MLARRALGDSGEEASPPTAALQGLPGNTSRSSARYARTWTLAPTGTESDVDVSSAFGAISPPVDRGSEPSSVYTICTPAGTANTRVLPAGVTVGGARNC